MTQNKQQNNTKYPESAAACRTLCLRLLNRRSYSEAELRRKMLERGASEDTAEAVLARLREEGLVNDAGLAESLIHYRSAVTRHGKFAVRRELSRRGIEPELAESVLTEEYDAETEAEAAFVFLQKQIRRLHLAEDEALPREKLFAAFARRGFSSEAVRRAFELWQEGNAADDNF